MFILFCFALCFITSMCAADGPNAVRMPIEVHDEGTKRIGRRHFIMRTVLVYPGRTAFRLDVVRQEGQEAVFLASRTMVLPHRHVYECKVSRLSPRMCAIFNECWQEVFATI